MDMANFLPAFERMILNEGSYKLHTVAGDRGGMTYAGIARNFWPSWKGWAMLDRGETVPSEYVRDFYNVNFWDKVRGDDIQSQDVARNLFDFAVNAGVKTAVSLAQATVGASPDGVLGEKTLSAINATDSELFVARYALAKMARYAAIVTKDRSQAKFILGWINRTLREASS